MSQSGYTPIQLYRTTTAAATPTAGNLAAGELAINLTDEKLYFKNAGGTVKLLASAAGAEGTVTSVAASGGTTGLTFSGSPITSSGTLTLGGTLGVANGGTGTTTAFTAGSVVFAGASGVYSQDNANLFWDNSNDRLGIGTATPAQKLDVNGSINAGVASGTTLFMANNSAIRNTATGGNTMYFDSGVGAGSTTGDFSFRSTASFATRLYINGNTGNIGVGTTSPAQRLDVFDGIMRVGGSSQGKLLAYSSSNTHVMDLGVSTGTGSGTDVGLYNLIAGNLTFGTNSAERMRIDSSGNVGIGTSSPSSRLTITGGNTEIRDGNYLLLRPVGNGWDMRLQATGTQLDILSGGALGSPIMSLVNGGNVGIGTTSPGAKLQINTQDGFRFDVEAGAASTMRFGSALTGEATGAMAFTRTTGAITFSNGSTGSALTERVRIAGTGDVGIGTSSPGQTLQVVNAGNYQFRLGAGSTFNYDIGRSTSDGFLYFYGNQSGFTGYVFSGADGERMRINASGNLIVGGTTAQGTASGRGNITINGSSTSILSFSNGGSLAGYVLHDGTDLWVNNVGAGAQRFYTNGTERMRIDSSGNLLVGATSAVGKFTLENAANTVEMTLRSTGGVGTNNRARIIAGYEAGGSDYGGYLAFNTTTSSNVNTERMRIDASGNLLVGTADPGPSSGQGVKLLPTGRVYSVITSSIADSYDLYNTTAAAYRFYVDNAGTIFATSTTISAISDIRLKENVRDLDAGLDTILALKPRRFDWKEGKGKDVKDDMGFIAQEVEEVLPALIGGWKAGEGEPEDLKSVKAGDLIPVLVKAIQELTARVAQLEGN